MHAGLALEMAVGVLAGDLDRRRLDAGLLAGQQVDHLGLEARPLAPAQVHAHEHLRPVLRFGAAGAGMNGQDRGLGVVRARQHDLELELVQLAPEPRQALGDVGVEAAVVARFLGQLEQDVQIGDLGGELADAGEGARELGALADQVLRAAVVLPEGRRRHLGVERGHPLLLGRQVKDASGARRAARSAR